ncbi:Receptor-like protein kinase [Melia azedarach]|uniref:Receptor-like protein kinase n=1 Tax=Melia azedarach TaxID=155640 RepID=A0ACC1Y391_MELAZ|nr:Receptor-like protein kinase [Melia azedarach]
MMTNPSVFVLILFLVYRLIHPFITAAAANNFTTDKDALLALKAHITNDPTNFLAKYWTTSISVCNWPGVTCDKIQRRVTTLNISGLNLAGTIPSQLGNLSSLQTLDLSHNRLSGTIPSSIVGIRTLRVLHIFHNQLSGSFPPLNNVSSFLSLDFRDNSLSGELPANICNHCPFLEVLYLKGNMFHGEIPSTLSECKQLVGLSLSTNNFSGSIPKEIGNLTNLKELYLTDNTLRGEIPQELGYLTQLNGLSLRNNLLTGTIPSSVFNLTSISVGMDFSINNLTGCLPEGMSQGLPFLQGLYVSVNQLTGRIPRDIGNLTSAKEIFLSFNNFIGEIPHEIGNLHSLEILSLANNSLTGVVPDTIFNVSRMKKLDLGFNALTGSLPSSIDLGLHNLEELYLPYNNFSGPIPTFIWNVSKLTNLEMGWNSFSGFIPNTLGNLRNLKRLSFVDNYLKSSNPELSFLSSLTNCNNLERLGLGGNPLHGILPSSIGNLSNSMKQLYIYSCNISGTIPEEIGNLINLTVLSLEHNDLNGSIPVSLGRLQKLQGLSLRLNKLQGSIPDSLCHLTALFLLELEGNKISGSIPPCIGNLTTLRAFLSSSNELTSIPLTFWNLTDILSFDFSSNSLTGPLPIEIGNLKVVTQIDLSRNLFSGDIPTTISGLKDLQFLALGYNSLKGPIPETFGNLISLQSLDLSNNNLSGVIPKSMEKLSFLKYLNLSFNRMEGEIPRGGSFGNFTAQSFMGNDLLCGSPNLQVPPCKSNKISTHPKSKKKVLVLGIILPLSTSIILSLGFVLVSRCRKRSTKLSNDADMAPEETRRRFSYLELLRATERFSESNLIGMGSFGSVYKARFQDGMEVAVKVFHLQFDGAFKSFDVECEVMKSIRHRNLVKILSSCSNDDFKALVLEYMPNGSLEKCLYSTNRILDVFQRLNIMIDVSSALEYLHFGYLTPVIHCDLKPSNVLLDGNMVARLSDFGIAKLLTGEDQSMTQTQTLATIGYMAPEYGREGKVSIKGDIYSYGIMLMETFTGTKPTEEFFAGEMSLKNWVKDLLHSSVIELVDKNLLRRDDEHFAAKERCVSSVLNLAIMCTAESPENRINAKDIVTRLSKIRGTLLETVEGRRRIRI